MKKEILKKYNIGIKIPCKDPLGGYHYNKQYKACKHCSPITHLAKKKVKNIFKDYWYYCGSWHNKECSFILFDQGVCNCKGINKELNKRLDKLL